MFLQHRRALANLLVFTQVVLAIALFWLLFAALVLVSWRSPQVFIRSYAIYCAVMAGGLFLELGRREPDHFVATVYESSLVSQFPLALRQLAFALGSLLILLALTQDHAVSRLFFAVFASLLYLLLVVTNARLPLFFVRTFFRQERMGRTLLVGSLAGAARLGGWLQRKEQFGWNVCGVISTAPTTETETDGIPVLGCLDDLEKALETTEALQVILLEYSAPELARLLISRCQRRGARLLIVNDVAEQLRHPTVCMQDEGLNIIALREEPLENPFNRLLKRGLDLAIAAPTAIFILPPSMALVWLLHRLQSPGPLWHRQARAGLQNRTFQIFKFRTMHLHDGPLAQQAAPGDARVFPAGRWLRRMSIDELPQCLNVLRGEMSVVGPRPHLIEHNLQFAEQMANYHIRSLIKPGITGLAQVRGFRGEARTAEDIAARLQSDLIYLENWSLTLELGILARTIWQILRPPPSAV